MAKGARSNVRKANNAKLRSTLYGPASDERTKRLSAKLQKVASQPRSKDADMEDADYTVTDKTQDKETAAEMDKEMEIDEQPGEDGPSSKEGGSNGFKKRVRRKKRPSITFKPHPGKLKRLGKKK